MPPDDLKIVSGERIGKLSLSMPVDDILKSLGTPSSVTRTATSIHYEWRGSLIKILQSLSTGEASSIRTIWVFGQINSYRTEDGLGIGDTENRVKQTHGSTGCFTQEGATWREYRWPSIGILYIINTSSTALQAIQYRVSEIGVIRKSDRVPGLPLRPCG